MINLSGKEAIVTGGGSGIGRGICAVLALAGARVLVTDVSIESAEETLKYCERLNNLTAAKIDVTDIASIEETVSRHVADRGKIDILVNNAGIVGSKDWWMRETPSNEDWLEVYEVNLRGMVKVSERVGKEFESQGSGKIVNIASISAVSYTHLTLPTKA